MQTFLPHPDYATSAKCLDRQRLGKQRVECLQIMRALVGETKGYANHPATQMWKGHEGSFIQYAYAVCDEWTLRGYQDTCKAKLTKLWIKFARANRLTLAAFAFEFPPPWLTEEFCRAHRSNLKRKLPSHYAQMFDNVPDNLPYIWPTKL